MRNEIQMSDAVKQIEKKCRSTVSPQAIVLSNDATARTIADRINGLREDHAFAPHTAIQEK
jgi:hypothetical protein